MSFRSIHCKKTGETVTVISRKERVRERENKGDRRGMRLQAASIITAKLNNTRTFRLYFYAGHALSSSVAFYKK